MKSIKPNILGFSTRKIPKKLKNEAVVVEVKTKINKFSTNCSIGKNVKLLKNNFSSEISRSKQQKKRSLFKKKGKINEEPNKDEVGEGSGLENLLNNLIEKEGKNLERNKLKRESKMKQEHSRQQEIQTNYNKEPQTSNLNYKDIDISSLKVLSVDSPTTDHITVPPLVEELRSVTLKRGAHLVNGFNDYYKQIVQPEDIDWSALPPFLTSSRDPILVSLATHSEERSPVTVTASSSSSTSILLQLQFLFTKFRRLEVSAFSPIFSGMPDNYTGTLRKPVQVVLRKRRVPEDLVKETENHWFIGPGMRRKLSDPVKSSQNSKKKDYVWALDSAPSIGLKTNSILMDLGKSMERMVTMPPEEFKAKMLNTKPNLEDEEEIWDSKIELTDREPVKFVQYDGILMRSQLDAAFSDPLSKIGVLDLKTRATYPIRMDINNVNKHTSYKLKKVKGLFNSFEREWYDMVRSAFPKYCLQCRLGHMSGVLVTFHNTKEIFGFEMITLNQMEKFMFGNTAFAYRSFRSGMILMDRLIKEITTEFEDESCLKLTFHSDPFIGNLQVWVEIVREINNEPKLLNEILKYKPPITYPKQNYVDDLDKRRITFGVDPVSIIVKLDWLETDDIRNKLKAVGLNDKGSRPEILSRLESYVGELLPGYAPAAHYKELGAKDLLHKYTVNMKHFHNNEWLIQGALNYEPGDNLQTKFSIVKENMHGDGRDFIGYFNLIKKIRLCDLHGYEMDWDIPIDENIFPSVTHDISISEQPELDEEKINM